MRHRVIIAVTILFASSMPVMGQIKIVGGGLGGGFSRSISVTNENGLKTTKVTENGKKFVIREGQDLIEVEFSNTYGPQDMEKLKEKHPDLHMHVSSFPKKSGDSSVELSVSVKEKVTAENESALKEKSETAFEIFEKYTKKGGGLGRPFAKIDLGGIDVIKPARLVEIEKDAEKRMEELRKKVREITEQGSGPLFGEKKDDKKVEGKKDEEKTPTKGSGNGKKDLIKT